MTTRTGRRVTTVKEAWRDGRLHVTVLRYAWTGPTTLLGVALAALAIPGGRGAVVDGVLEVHGPLLDWLLRRAVPIEGGAAAITLGHVVLGRHAAALEMTRSHERVHVRQCERWGPLFLPAYLIASVCALLRGRDSYLDNRFEVEARREAVPRAECSVLSARWQVRLPRLLHLTLGDGTRTAHGPPGHEARRGAHGTWHLARRR